MNHETNHEKTHQTNDYLFQSVDADELKPYLDKWQQAQTELQDQLAAIKQQLAVMTGDGRDLEWAKSNRVTAEYKLLLLDLEMTFTVLKEFEDMMTPDESNMMYERFERELDDVQAMEQTVHESGVAAEYVHEQYDLKTVLPTTAKVS